MKNQVLRAMALIWGIALLLVSCAKEESFGPDAMPAASVNIVSPYGDMVAPGVEDLKVDVAAMFSRRANRPVMPEQVAIRHIDFVAGPNVRAAVITATAPEGAFTFLRILHVRKGYTLRKEAGVLRVVPADDPELVPNIPKDYKCTGLCPWSSGCHWEWVGTDAAGHNVVEGFLCSCPDPDPGAPPPPFPPECWIE